MVIVCCILRGFIIYVTFLSFGIIKYVFYSIRLLLTGLQNIYKMYSKEVI